MCGPSCPPHARSSIGSGRRRPRGRSCLRPAPRRLPEVRLAADREGVRFERENPSCLASCFGACPRRDPRPAPHTRRPLPPYRIHNSVIVYNLGDARRRDVTGMRLRASTGGRVSNLDRRKFLAGSAAAAATVAWQPRLLGAAALPGVPLVMGCTTEPTSFDPLFQYFGPNRQAHFPVFEPLAAYDARLGVVPALAESWSLLDPTTWEFILRDSVRFHDGTILEAQDVIFSLERVSTV